LVTVVVDNDVTTCRNIKLVSFTDIVDVLILWNI